MSSSVPPLSNIIFNEKVTKRICLDFWVYSPTDLFWAISVIFQWASDILFVPSHAAWLVFWVLVSAARQSEFIYTWRYAPYARLSSTVRCSCRARCVFYFSMHGTFWSKTKPKPVDQAVCVCVSALGQLTNNKSAHLVCLPACVVLLFTLSQDKMQ